MAAIRLLDEWRTCVGNKISTIYAWPTDTNTAIGNSGYSLAQALLSQQFPDGMVTWGGRTLTSE